MIDFTKLTDSQLDNIINSYAGFNATDEQSRNFAAAYREREVRKKLAKRMTELQRREVREQSNKDFNNEVEGRLAMMGY